MYYIGSIQYFIESKLYTMLHLYMYIFCQLYATLSQTAFSFYLVQEVTQNQTKPVLVGADDTIYCTVRLVAGPEIGKQEQDISVQYTENIVTANELEC